MQTVKIKLKQLRIKLEINRIKKRMSCSSLTTHECIYWLLYMCVLEVLLNTPDKYGSYLLKYNRPLFHNGLYQDDHSRVIFLTPQRAKKIAHFFLLRLTSLGHHLTSTVLEGRDGYFATTEQRDNH